MDLIDVKRTKADKKAESDRWRGDDVEQMDDYPYGLNIHLDEEVIAKLNLGDIDAGEPVMLVSEAVITEDRINTINGKTRRSLSIQLRKISITQEAAKTDVSTALYGS